jgi:hypothetical protein
LKDPREELAELSAALRHQLEREGRKGKTHLSLRAPRKPAPSRGKKLSVIDVEPEAEDYAVRMKQLDELAREASGCEKCDLCQTRNKVVFARGRARNRGSAISGCRSRNGQGGEHEQARQDGARKSASPSTTAS